MINIQRLSANAGNAYWETGISLVHWMVIGTWDLNATMLSFTDRVRHVVAAIPWGRTLTYKEVAEAAGRTRACRAVGNILAKNFDPVIPCHRVISSNGGLGGYNKGKERKRFLLKQEGFRKMPNS